MAMTYPREHPTTVAGGDESGPIRRLRVTPALRDVSLASEALSADLQGAFGEERGCQLRLGLTEAMTNVAVHGCKDQADGWMELDVLASPTQWCFRLADNGRPVPDQKFRAADGSVFNFDPTDVAALPENGLGLSLIRMVFDRVDYRCMPGRNELLLTVFLPATRAVVDADAATEREDIFRSCS
jgi:serine/threonine-protein kinase RsbW